MNTKNLFIFNEPYLINNKCISQLEYVSTFVKGKKYSLPKDYRFIMKTKDNLLVIIWFDKQEWVGNTGFIKYDFISIDTCDFKQLNSTHFRNRNYNYYYKLTDPNTLHNAINDWLNSNPLVHMSNYIHSHIETLKFNNIYKPIYTFEDINY